MLGSRKYGNYQIIKLLGEGGYGEVFLALNCEDNKEYAIKVLDKNKIVNENLDNYIKSEIQLLKQVDHPYIVKLIEVMATNRKVLLVMEFVEGGDLFDAIKQEPKSQLSEDTARLYFQQIIMAIDYCHKLNILHRDLKPENILLDKKNNCIKISDFGLAQSIQHKDEIISDIAGTTSYLAPEVIKQTGYLGQSADIWSTGVILFNCVTGTFPFFAKEPGEVLHVILEGNVKYPEYLSSDLVDLLKKIFVLNPKQRFTVQQIIDHRWFQKNLEPIKFCLEKNKITDLNFLKQSSHSTRLNKIVQVTTIYEFPHKFDPVSKNLIVIPSEIPKITCFELVSMISGNYISNIFEKNKNTSKNYERLIFKFIILIQIENALKCIFNFFNEKGKEIEFISCDTSRLLLDLEYKKNRYKFFLIMHKVSESKYIFKFSYKQGDKLIFKKLMKSFFEINKNNFTLF